jgi:uncharacterized Fe-S center protein
MEIIEELGIQVNTSKLFNMDKTGLTMKNCPENIVAQSGKMQIICEGNQYITQRECNSCWLL